MSSFNNVRKIKYFREPDVVVALEEYIVFEDERAKEKFVVFKFVNNISQQLLGMEFDPGKISSSWGDFLDIPSPYIA